MVEIYLIQWNFTSNVLTNEKKINLRKEFLYLLNSYLLLNKSWLPSWEYKFCFFLCFMHCYPRYVSTHSSFSLSLHLYFPASAHLYTGNRVRKKITHGSDLPLAESWSKYLWGAYYLWVSYSSLAQPKISEKQKAKYLNTTWEMKAQTFI